MDVPFISSGALGRAHYSLVRHVENAGTAQEAERYIFSEISTARRMFRETIPSHTTCKELLVILLYCSMQISGPVTRGLFDFALPHAIALAETGKSIGEKRIGYLFCSEVMSREHELQLMLVNTLRKDLDCPSLSRICLALDVMIDFSSEDLVPAVQSRVQDLLSHNSPHIRRRSVLASRALSKVVPAISEQVSRSIVKRIKDPDPSVVNAAVIVAAGMVEYPSSQTSVNDVMKGFENSKDYLSPPLRQIMHTLLLSSSRDVSIAFLMDVVRFAAESQSSAVLLETFMLLSNLPTSALVASKVSSPVCFIRHLLRSRNPNDQYIFLACLECIDPFMWAGTTEEVPAALEQLEVEQVMQLLDSSDSLMRIKTLKILSRVDIDIVASYYARSLQAVTPKLSAEARNERTVRLVEVIKTQTGNDGGTYSRLLNNMMTHVEGGGNHSVMESVVEIVLLHARNSGSSFGEDCAATLLTHLSEEGISLGTTLIVIACALACEYSGRLSISPSSILQGLAKRVASYPQSVQDACLLTMIRLAADCEAPAEVTGIVIRLSHISGRHIQRRCNQFISFASERSVLAEIVRDAQSSSLPDFLEALSAHTKTPARDQPKSPRSPLSPPLKTSINQLRYAPYETPLVVPRLLTRRPSSSQRSVGSAHSSTLSDHGGDASPTTTDNRMSRTITAGDLTLAAGSPKFQMLLHTAPTRLGAQPQRTSPIDDLSLRMDLIAFDLPFVPDSTLSRSERNPADTEELDFERTWDSLKESSGARGWCNLSIDDVVRCLQGLEHSRLNVISVDRSPFVGDLKVIIHCDQRGGLHHAVLRLRESEEDSCLWRLRCGDPELRLGIKQLLSDG